MQRQLVDGFCAFFGPFFTKSWKQQEGFFNLCLMVVQLIVIIAAMTLLQ